MSTCEIQTIAGQTCVVCPEQPFIPAVPTQVITDRLLGWNASAFSVTRLGGDVFTQFDVPLDVVGAMVGLANERRSDDPRDLPHGLYAFKDSGRALWAVSEAGVLQTAPVTRVGTDVFRIERRASVVRYFVNGQQVYTSTVPSFGVLVVVGLLFTAGDTVN